MKQAKRQDEPIKLDTTPAAAQHAQAIRRALSLNPGRVRLVTEAAPVEHKRVIAL